MALENKHIIIISIILSIIILTWFLYPKKESYEDNAVLQNPLPGHQPSNTLHGPSIDAATGHIQDGPGFEQAPMGVTQDIPNTIPSNYYYLDDGANGHDTVIDSLCSKSCCSAQWNLPFSQAYDPFVCKNKDKFVPSNLMCNNTFQDTGCLCLTKQSSQALGTRGGNGNSFF